jgi:glycosyltransferase involved in cell wall biosynthesis
MATVTIAIPVYNEEHYIAEAIDSVLNQDYADFKLVIGDNKSTDRTWEIIQSYAEKDSRIEAIQHEENKGLHDNWKYLLNAATTQYFMWLGAHDSIKPEYLSRCLKIYESNENVAVAFPGCECIDLDSNILAKGDKDYMEYNDDIDSTSLNRLGHKWVKFLTNIFTGTPLHGLYKTEYVQVSSLKRVFAQDVLLLFTLLQYGDICIDSKYKGYCRRIEPIKAPKEATPAEFLKFYKEKGVVDKNIDNVFYPLVKGYLNVVLGTKELNFDKIKFSYYLYILHGKKKKTWNLIKLLK